MDKPWLVVLALVITIGFLNILLVDMDTFSQNLEWSDDVFSNLFIGYAPAATSPELIDDSTTLVYVEVYWKDFEPREGKYDYEAIEEKYALQDLRDRGIHLVLRFICDYPGESSHLDIPRWLYDKIDGDGTYYTCSYGKGFSPDYSNETFIECHRKAVEALGERYGDDTFISYIEVGSVGHWGEWHVNYSSGIQRLPKLDVLERYVTPWVEAFPNAKIMVRRPFSFAEKYSLGVFNDVTGDPAQTYEWLDWIENGGVYSQTGEENGLIPMNNVWNTSPVGGELTSGISQYKLLDSNLNTTLKLIKASHMSFIGPKIAEAEYTKGYDAILGLLGYRYVIDDVKISKFFWSYKLTFTLYNTGVAPMYWDLPLRVYIYDSSNHEVSSFDTNIKLSELTGDTSKKITVMLNVKDLVTKIKEENWSVWVGIVDPMTGKDAVRFANEATQKKGRMQICSNQ